MDFNMQSSEERNNKWECEICHKKISNDERVIVEETTVCRNPACIRKAELEEWANHPDE